MVVGCLWGFGSIRAAVLALRGVYVIAIDPERTARQGLADLGAFAALSLWAYEAVAFAWPLRRHLVPHVLGTVVIAHAALRVLGGVTIVAALGLWLAAMHAMGAAWRIGIDRSSPGNLVTHGIFGWTRNPIYLAFDLLVVGTFLVQGRLLFLVLAIVLPLLLHGVILREERFLAQRHGAAYEAYRARVGRYLTV